MSHNIGTLDVVVLKVQHYSGSKTFICGNSMVIYVP